MRITLSEPRFTEQIRQLENLGPEVSTDEISHRMDRYARRLFNHVREFGVQMLPGIHISGTLAAMQASLNQSRSEEEVQMRVQGLALLAPVSVSLDQPDLSAFVVNPIMLASMFDNWSAFSQSLQRVTLSELRDAIENAAISLMSAPVAAPTNFYEAEVQQLEYEAFLAASGKKDPLAKHDAIEAHRVAEETAFAAAQQAARDREWNRD